MHRFEKLKKFSINIFEINPYHDQNKWKHKIILFEVVRNETNREIDLLIYKNHYVLIKKLNVFLDKQDCIYL